MQSPERTDVHVWHANVEQPAAVFERLHGGLLPEEQARAARFVQHADYRRFVVGRAALRMILAGYLGDGAYRLPLPAGTHGKPCLPPGLAGPDVRFNLSHSGARLLIGVAVGRDIGVDVEQFRDGLDLESMARHFFSAVEADQVLGLPLEQRQAAFYRCWTRKEAYMKARGQGLSLGLDRFEVSLLPGEPAALRRHLDDPDAPARWRLYGLQLPAGYAGAVAVEGSQHQLTELEWHAPA